MQIDLDNQEHFNMVIADDSKDEYGSNSDDFNSDDDSCDYGISYYRQRRFEKLGSADQEKENNFTVSLAGLKLNEGAQSLSLPTLTRLNTRDASKKRF